MSSGWRTGTAGADEVAVLLGLGTNLGDRAANLRTALGGLAQLGTVERMSRVYESEPYGFTAQPRFLNMAIRLRTPLAPAALLRAVKALEVSAGRTVTHRMGPRVIDIDILLYGDLHLDAPGLRIPHPGLMDRAFVLAPLLDIEPGMRHPVSGARLDERLAALDAGSIALLGTAADVLGLDGPGPTGAPA